MFKVNNRTYGCPLELTVSVLAGKWKILILTYLRRGSKRYGELFTDLDGITHKVLTSQLRELEADGLVLRTVYPEVPPKVEYSLTSDGEQLIPVILDMADWGMRFYIGADPVPASATGPLSSPTSEKP